MTNRQNMTNQKKKNPSKSSGLFITFEGGEGAGKTTLIQSLATALIEQGLPVVTTREPGGTKLGETIREMLLHREDDVRIDKQAELLLFLVDRVQHLDELILPALAAGKIVLCDRFNDSTIAYQGGGRELGIASTQKLCNEACRGIQPDMTFYLDIDPQIGLKRRRKASVEDRFEEQADPFHERVRNAFQSLAQQEPQRIQVIDASRSPGKVLQQVLQATQSLLAALKGA